MRRDCAAPAGKSTLNRLELYPTSGASRYHTIRPDGAAIERLFVALLGQLRERWPKIRTIRRADSGFCREALMGWCGENRVDYVFRLARKSWSRSRRVVAKAEHSGDKSNPRFIVTWISTRQVMTRALYEDFYCARGEVENRIKECQLDLFADRLSTKTLRGNQLRVGWASAAYVLLHVLRQIGIEEITTRVHIQYWMGRRRRRTR